MWPKPLPNHWVLGSTIEVSVDSRDHVYIIHRHQSLNLETEASAGKNTPAGTCCMAAPPVIEFDAQGNVVASWGGPAQGHDWPTSNHGITVDHMDNIWIGGNDVKDAHLLKFSRAGQFLLQLGKPEANQGSNDAVNFWRVAEISIDAEANEAYVADGYGNKRVVVLDATTGERKRYWGAYGNRPDDTDLGVYDPSAPLAQQFRNPVHCAEPTRDGFVYVCDRVNDRIQVFRKDGTFVSELRVAPETRGAGSVWDIALSHDPGQAYIYLADGVNERVYIIHRASMQILTSFGDGGRQPGSSSACTTSPSTRKATSTRPKPTKVSASRSSCFAASRRFREKRKALYGRSDGDNDENHDAAARRPAPARRAWPNREAGPWWPNAEWGPTDQAGASNRITPEKILASSSLVKTGRVYEIGQVYEAGMPLAATRDYSLRLVATGQAAGPNRVLYNDEFLAAEVGQVGTQFDGLGHIGGESIRRRQHATRFLQWRHSRRDEREHRPPPARHRARQPTDHARRARRFAGLQGRAAARRRIRGDACRRPRRACSAKASPKLDHARRRRLFRMAGRSSGARRPIQRGRLPGIGVEVARWLAERKVTITAATRRRTRFRRTRADSSSPCTKSS